MAYAGRTPTTGFRSVPTKDTFSGDGSTVAFTLSLSTRTNDVEVFVENVQQEPTTAYSISGNTLTFTSAPVTGTNNIYVIHRGELVSNGVHTPGADLQAVNATITGDLTVSGTTITMDSASVQTVDLGDNDKIRLGDADDLQLYWDGTTGQLTNDVNVTGTVTADGAVINSQTTLTGELSVTSASDSRQITFARTDASGGEGGIGANLFNALNVWNDSATNALTIAQNNDISFYEDTGTTPKLFWDASAERLGLGTSSPTAELDILGGIRLNKFGNLSTAKVGNFGVTNFEGYISPYNENGKTEIHNTTSSGYIAFFTSTSDTERMRLDSSGNLKFNSGYGSVATAYGCRAWVNFNGTGTVAIRQSGNVSSITDVSTGIYRVNFTTSITDANYCALASVEGSGAAERVIPYSYLTTSVNLYCTSQTTLQDMSFASCAIIR